jgi:uridine kinase
MKVALLISGYLRSFKINIPSLQEKILSKFDKVDVYIHITNNEDKEDRYINDNNECEDIEYIKKNLNPVCIIQESNLSYNDDKKINDVINLWAKYYKLNEIKKLNEKHQGNYDLVIKYRPDVDILSDINFTDIKGDEICIPKNSKIDKSKLSNSNDKYICDILAWGNTWSMNRYFGVYENIEHQINMGWSNVSESILYNYLTMFGIKYKLVDVDYGVILSSCNVFAIAGDSGSGKTTLANILKKYFSNSIMLEGDRYHKWERGDDNWKNFTHLNPDANYLTKMNEDIFDLKIGKTIYQVDYDHQNGKFTEKEQIDSSDNIIVCGLHTLYGQDELYDFKIFINTEKYLKDRWKIKRDVFERGYSIESVKEQIEKREQDYEFYILPQIEKSDIVINFFSHKKDQPIEEEESIGLRVFVKKGYSIGKILHKLYDLGYNKEKYVSYNDDTCCFTFNKYEKIDFFDGKIPLLGNYYDYILFILFNLKKTIK